MRRPDKPSRTVTPDGSPALGLELSPMADCVAVSTGAHGTATFGWLFTVFSRSHIRSHILLAVAGSNSCVCLFLLKAMVVHMFGLVACAL